MHDSFDYDEDDLDRKYGRRKGVPFQSTNRFRKDGEHGWREPKEDERSLAYMADTIVGAVRATIAGTFGAAGMRAFNDLNPNLFADLRASCIEMYREGHYDAHGDALCERGREAERNTWGMVSALLESARLGEDDEKTKLRALSAHAGIKLDKDGKPVDEEGEK